MSSKSERISTNLVKLLTPQGAEAVSLAHDVEMQIPKEKQRLFLLLDKEELEDSDIEDFWEQYHVMLVHYMELIDQMRAMMEYSEEFHIEVHSADDPYSMPLTDEIN